LLVLANSLTAFFSFSYRHHQLKHTLSFGLVLGLRFGLVPSFGFGLSLCLVLGFGLMFGFAPSFGLVLSK
jgi:uncharacterized protein (DUF2062 family)